MDNEVRIKAEERATRRYFHQFIVKVANVVDDAVRRIEVMFEYHAEIERNKLFRK